MIFPAWRFKKHRMKHFNMHTIYKIPDRESQMEEECNPFIASFYLA